jgi:hypothetical protein
MFEKNLEAKRQRGRELLEKRDAEKMKHHLRRKGYRFLTPNHDKVPLVTDSTITDALDKHEIKKEHNRAGIRTAAKGISEYVKGHLVIDSHGANDDNRRREINSYPEENDPRKLTHARHLRYSVFTRATEKNLLRPNNRMKAETGIAILSHATQKENPQLSATLSKIERSIDACDTHQLSQKSLEDQIKYAKFLQEQGIESLNLLLPHAPKRKK